MLSHELESSHERSNLKTPESTTTAMLNIDTLSASLCTAKKPRSIKEDQKNSKETRRKLHAMPLLSAHHIRYIPSIYSNCFHLQNQNNHRIAPMIPLTVPRINRIITTTNQANHITPRSIHSSRTYPPRLTHLNLLRRRRSIV
jgi:hypothetical protein